MFNQRALLFASSLNGELEPSTDSSTTISSLRSAKTRSPSKPLEEESGPLVGLSDCLSVEFASSVDAPAPIMGLDLDR